MDSKSLIDEYFGKDLRIPIYQRSYDWKVENCQVLFNDLLTSSRNLDKPRISNHFFGSVITMIDQLTYVNDVIDGQQRIVTISLLLAAMRDCLNSHTVESVDTSLNGRLDDLVRDRYDRMKVYIKPVEKDAEAYDSIIRNLGNNIETSNITINYNLFVKLVSTLPPDITVDQLFQAIRKLRIMAIHLDVNDDAQAIFESINSTGLDLSEADKIRNFILMNHEPSIQEHLYRDYWVKIEKNLSNENDLSEFFKNYLTAIKQTKVTIGEIYREFKKTTLLRVSEDEQGTYDQKFESLMNEIYRYSEIYASILSSDLDYISKKSSEYMRYIRFMKVSVSYPFLMRLIYEYSYGTYISSEDVENVLSSVENLLVRRLICGKWTTGLNSFFAPLFQSVSKLHSDSSFSDKLNYVLLSKTGAMAYIKDEEVKDGFNNVDLYRSDTTAASIVLALLEDSNLDTEDVLSRIPDYLTIEHIMPQNQTEAWKAMFGDNYEEMHPRWLNKLGNLTLTAYNAKLSDRPFIDKLNHEYGYLNSTLHLNQFARECNGVWTEKEIEKRQNSLIDRFLKIMPEMTTSVAITPDVEELSLEDDPELFTSWNIMGCRFKGEEIKGNAKSVFPKIVRLLYDLDPQIIVRKVDVEGTGFYSENKAAGTNDCVEVAPGVFVWNHYSNSSRVTLLKKMFSWFNLQDSDLVFYGKSLKYMHEDRL